MKIKIRDIVLSKKLDDLVDTQATVNGWIGSLRNQKAFAFLTLNDGSCSSSLQIILDANCENFLSSIQDLNVGASVQVQGKIVQSPGKNQALELHASSIAVIGKCPPENYPLQKKRHSFEYLRTIAHLRPRTNTQGSVARVRNALFFATHTFFQERQFVYVQTPIITGSDCEGGGEMFHVTTIEEKEKSAKDVPPDFFGKKAFLTVSGQLEAEIYASALSNVYTFGPTFRAENSHTTKHLSEFWMIEPELAFADLTDDIACAESYLQYVIKYALEKCPEDLEFFEKFIEKGVISRLEKMLKAPFAKISYTEAISLLQKSNKKFDYPTQWGDDLQTEHEKFLTDEVFGGPVVVTDYPKEIKAFYMRQNDDNKTVAAMDILVPKVGELVGGSQREERLDMLTSIMKRHNMNLDEYWWYIDLRRYGSVPHAGFGVGFERLVQYVTGMENIRDVSAFPRYPNHIEF